MSKKILSKRSLTAVALILAAVFSALVLSGIASSPKSHAPIIESLDEKQATIIGITATAAATATALSAVPGDSTTAIADQIMETSGYLMIIVCVIFLEKILLSIFGYLSFGFLIPIAFVMLALYLYKRKESLKIWATKIILFALAIFMIIPVSVKIADLIEKTYEISVEQALEDAISMQEESNQDKNWFKTAIDSVTDFSKKTLNKTQDILWSFINSIAVLIVTSIIIPLLVIFALISIIKLIFGITINPISIHKLNPLHKQKSEETSVKMND